MLKERRMSCREVIKLCCRLQGSLQIFPVATDAVYELVENVHGCPGLLKAVLRERDWHD